MKQPLSPGIVVGAIVAIVLLVGAIFVLGGRSPAGSEEGKNTGTGIPPEISKQIGERMSGAGAPGGATAPTAGQPGMGGYRPGGMMAPPPGSSGMGGR